MSVNKIRLIGFDLDGTLLNPEKDVSSYTRNVLKQCAGRGILLVPVTGRPLHGIPQSVRSIPELTHLICSNGAMTVDLKTGEILRRKAMSYDLSLEILKRFPENCIREVFIAGYGYHDAVTHKLWKKRHLIPAQQIYLKESRRDVRSLSDFLKSLHEYLSGSSYPSESLFQEMDPERFHVSDRFLTEDIFVSTESETEQKKILSNAADLKDRCQIVESFATDLEFGSLHADKGEALLELAQMYGISPSETAAFGDGGNDIGFMQRAGVAVAMGNAIPSILTIADFVTDDNAHDGVAKGIVKILQL